MSSKNSGQENYIRRDNESDSDNPYTESERTEDRRSLLQSNPLVTKAIAKANIKEMSSQSEESSEVERVSSKKDPNIKVPTSRQWEEYKRGLAVAKVLEREEAILGYPLVTGSKQWQNVVDSVDVETEMAALKGPKKGFPHAKSAVQTINNRWDYKVEVGANPWERELTADEEEQGLNSFPRSEDNK